MALDVFSSLFGGSESSGSSRTFLDPQQKALLDKIFGRTEGFLNAPRPGFFQPALNQFASLGLNNPLLNTAAGDITNTLTGGLSPGFQQQMEAFQRQVTPQIDARFNQAGGRVGSGLHREALGRAFADAGANLISQERGRALQALPGVVGQQRSGLAALLNFDPEFQRLMQARQIAGTPITLSQSQTSGTSAGGGLLDLIAGGMFLGGVGPFKPGIG